MAARTNRVRNLYLVNQYVRLAGEPGFEPGLTESESVGLPLTYSPLLGTRYLRNSLPKIKGRSVERRAAALARTSASPLR